MVRKVLNMPYYIWVDLRRLRALQIILGLGRSILKGLALLSLAALALLSLLALLALRPIARLLCGLLSFLAGNALLSDQLLGPLSQPSTGLPVFLTVLRFVFHDAPQV